MKLHCNLFIDVFAVMAESLYTASEYDDSAKRGISFSTVRYIVMQLSLDSQYKSDIKLIEPNNF